MHVTAGGVRVIPRRQTFPRKVLWAVENHNGTIQIGANTTWNNCTYMSPQMSLEHRVAREATSTFRASVDWAREVSLEKFLHGKTWMTYDFYLQMILGLFLGELLTRKVNRRADIVKW